MIEIGFDIGKSHREISSKTHNPFDLSGITLKSIILDASLRSLVLSNLITIFLAISQNWNILTVMWVYWIQSMIIGFFNFIRIISLKQFSTEGMTVNGSPIEPSAGNKIFYAIFFAFHYSGFHFVYALFLKGYPENLIDFNSVLFASGIFFLNHMFSYFYNKKKDTPKENLGRLMMFPYTRILPMHLTIIFGSFLEKGMLIIFLLLKTVADLIMHIKEHEKPIQDNVDQKSQQITPPVGQNVMP